MWELWQHPAVLLQGLPFSLTLLPILLAHEFGHYLAAVYHRVDASLPYFMPSPFLGLSERSSASARRSIPSACSSISASPGRWPDSSSCCRRWPSAWHSRRSFRASRIRATFHFGVPGLQWLLVHAIFPGVRRRHLSAPGGARGLDRHVRHRLNLLPIGQLDGGHILYSFFPQRHRTVSKILCILMLTSCGCLGVPGLPATV